MGSLDDQLVWDNAPAGVKQVLVTHSAQALRTLLREHPELADISSERIALIFQAGAAMGMDLAQIGRAMDERESRNE